MFSTMTVRGRAARGFASSLDDSQTLMDYLLR